MLQFYNTLGREKQEFVSLKKGKVSMYACGPTVYNFVHIGNLRAYVFDDLLHRYLSYRGYEVDFVMNITDVDDKIIRDLPESGKTLSEFTEFYTNAFFEDMELINVRRPRMIKATDYIDRMVEFIKSMEQAGFAYERDGSWYFAIEKQNGYGCLACLDRQELQFNASGRLTEVDEDLDGVNDFVLWKGYKEEDGEVYWETELGKGRPGWHIECSVMSTAELGNTFDIHCGGADLIFPHHTNEIAQSKAATGEDYAKYWMHNAHLQVDGEKMSKSLGNFYTLRDVMERGFHPLLVRLMLLRTHYRSPLDFRFDLFDEMQTIVDKVVEVMAALRAIDCEKDNEVDAASLIDAGRTSFVKALDDDLNISDAFTALYDYLGEVNKVIGKIGSKEAFELFEFIVEMDEVFGVFAKAYAEYAQALLNVSVDEEVKVLVLERETYRAENNWEKSDEIRDLLLERNVTVKDVEGGTQLGVKDYLVL